MPGSTTASSIGADAAEPSAARVPATLSTPALPYVATAIAICLYLAALALGRDWVPAGLNNDAAEEALRGIYLLEAGRFEVITEVIGIPQETLYEYATAVVAKALGTTTLAIHLMSWAAGLITIALFVALVRRIAPQHPQWVAALTICSSIWLFHYARSGLRATAAPVFLLGVTLLLDRSERSPRSVALPLACGALLGLGLYAYTSCRVLVVALLFHAAFQLWRATTDRQALARSYGWILAAATVVSIPNLTYFARAPAAWLLRGGYVVPKGTAVVEHLFWSVLLPFHYPERYRTLSSPVHIFDGVSAGLTSAGVSPIHPLLALLLLVGVVGWWRRRRETWASYLFWVWVASMFALGISGPSLTRLLVVLPVLLLLAVMGALELVERLPRARVALLLGLSLITAHHAFAYFVTFARNTEAQEYFSPAATPIGRSAREIGLGARRVACVISKDANVVRYLTHDVADRVHIVEFYQRPVNPAELGFDSFRPDILLIEAIPRFEQLLAGFPGAELDASGRFAVADLLKAPPPAAPGAPMTDVAALLARSQTLAQAGDPDQALSLLLEAQRLAPQSAEVHHFLSNVFYLRGELRNALAAIERAAALDPTNALYARNVQALRRELAAERP